jgi:hypothetical protein
MIVSARAWEMSLATGTGWKGEPFQQIGGFACALGPHVSSL